jgi:hypothetical protein
MEFANGIGILGESWRGHFRLVPSKPFNAPEIGKASG